MEISIKEEMKDFGYVRSKLRSFEVVCISIFWSSEVPCDDKMLSGFSLSVESKEISILEYKSAVAIDPMVFTEVTVGDGTSAKATASVTAAVISFKGNFIYY